jgi:hypothetical protein
MHIYRAVASYTETATTATAATAACASVTDSQIKLQLLLCHAAADQLHAHHCSLATCTMCVLFVAITIATATSSHHQ